jgi:hypothetical protein
MAWFTGLQITRKVVTDGELQKGQMSIMINDQASTNTSDDADIQKHMLLFFGGKFPLNQDEY